MYSFKVAVPATRMLTQCRGQTLKHPSLHRLWMAPAKIWDSNQPVSRCYSMAAKDMGESDFQKIKVNRDRLMKSLHETCEFGTGERWGRQVGVSPSRQPFDCPKAALTKRQRTHRDGHEPARPVGFGQARP